MKKYLFLTSLLFTAATSLCQSIYPYEEIRLIKPADYMGSEPLALSAATFLLSSPYKEKDINRSHALEFLKKWMAGTKEFTFRLSGVGQDIAEDHDLLDLFTAAMVKFCLENKPFSTNSKLVEESACKIVLTYCDNPVNNFRLKKKQRKKLQ